MPGSSQSGVTELLGRLRAGEKAAEGKLFDRVHAELRQLAKGQRKRWEGDPTLRTTALAHEAYLNLVDEEERSWEDRSHFFAVAARAMRHILIDRARRKRAEKRGGEDPLLSLETLRNELGRAVGEASESAEQRVTTGEGAEMLVLLDEALDRFEETSTRAARVVEYRFFGGMTIEETAEALGVSASTVSRDSDRAKAWLYREMKRMRGEGEATEEEDPDS